MVETGPWYPPVEDQPEYNVPFPTLEALSNNNVVRKITKVLIL